MSQHTFLPVLRLFNPPFSAQASSLIATTCNTPPAQCLFPLADSNDDEIKAFLGAEVCKILVSEVHKPFPSRHPRALSVDAGQRLVLYTLPADLTFTISSILGDPDDSKDFGMSVEEFLTRVDATVMVLNDEGIRSSFMAAHAVIEHQRHRPLSSVRARLRVVDCTAWLVHLETTTPTRSHRRNCGDPKFRLPCSSAHSLTATTEAGRPGKPSIRAASGFVKRLLGQLRPFSLARLLNLPHTGSWDPTPLTYDPSEDSESETLFNALKSYIMKDLHSDYAPSYRALRLYDDDEPRKLLVYSVPKGRLHLQTAKSSTSVSAFDPMNGVQRVVLLLPNPDVRSSFKIAEAVTAHAHIQPLSSVRARLRVSPLRPSLPPLSSDLVPPYRTRAHKACSALKHLGTRFIPRSIECTYPNRRITSTSDISYHTISANSHINSSEISMADSLHSTAVVTPAACSQTPEVHAVDASSLACSHDESTCSPSIQTPIQAQELVGTVDTANVDSRTLLDYRNIPTAPGTASRILPPIHEESIDESGSLAISSLLDGQWLLEEELGSPEAYHSSLFDDDSASLPGAAHHLPPENDARDGRDPSFKTFRVGSALRSVINTFDVSNPFGSLTKGRRTMLRMVSNDALDDDISHTGAVPDYADEWVCLKGISVLQSVGTATEARPRSGASVSGLPARPPPTKFRPTFNKPTAAGLGKLHLKRFNTTDGVPSHRRNSLELRLKDSDAENRATVFRSASLKLTRRAPSSESIPRGTKDRSSSAFGGSEPRDSIQVGKSGHSAISKRKNAIKAAGVLAWRP